jgi:hypothetical protein
MLAAFEKQYQISMADGIQPWQVIKSVESVREIETGPKCGQQ